MLVLAVQFDTTALENSCWYRLSFIVCWFGTSARIHGTRCRHSIRTYVTHIYLYSAAGGGGGRSAVDRAANDKHQLMMIYRFFATRMKIKRVICSAGLSNHFLLPATNAHNRTYGIFAIFPIFFRLRIYYYYLWNGIRLAMVTNQWNVSH